MYEQNLIQYLKKKNIGTRHTIIEQRATGSHIFSSSSQSSQCQSMQTVYIHI